MEFILIIVGLLAILLAFLANWLGIDNNSVWGAGRFLILIIGIFLLLVAFLVRLWKTGRISSKVRYAITNTAHILKSSFTRLFNCYRTARSTLYVHSA